LLTAVGDRRGRYRRGPRDGSDATSWYTAGHPNRHRRLLSLTVNENVFTPPGIRTTTAAAFFPEKVTENVFTPPGIRTADIAAAAAFFPKKKNEDVFTPPGIRTAAAAFPKKVNENRFTPLGIRTTTAFIPKK
jgi:hypothetical protein